MNSQNNKRKSFWKIVRRKRTQLFREKSKEIFKNIITYYKT
jgi:hypothetical protein